ncbi:MAG: LysR family transcriptional regulator [Gammaproteobacteria bacterium]|nr:LysR family transcriptional regulator [Gammaproteobacteria bacterium]
MTDNNNLRFKGGLPDYLIRHTTFRQMQIFEAIVRLGSFTRAAEELFLTQPTVSSQIKKLTNVMGLPLLDQSGRSIKPTDAGNDLYQAIRQIFDCLSDLDTRLAGLKGLQRGRLRLAVVTTAKYFTPEILGDFCRKHNAIDVTLKVPNRDEIIERIQNNEDDLYILGQLPTKLESHIEAHCFAPNPLVVMAPKDHPLCKETNISIERLAKETFVFREVGSGIRDAAMKVFAEHGIVPNVRMELGSNEAIKHAVVGGLGLTISSLHTLTLEGASGPIAMLDVQGFPIQRKWYIVHPKDKELSLIAKTFLEFALSSEPIISARMQSLLNELSVHKKPIRGQGSAT